VLRGGAQSEDELTPAAVVAMLDRFIVGQPEAKRAMAVALRSRWRRRKIASAGLKVSARTICISVPCEAVLWAPLSRLRTVRMCVCQGTEQGGVQRGVGCETHAGGC
jgi:hypothetical protein